MAIFGKKGFIRRQETAIARKLLIWKYEQSGTPLPGEAALSAQARQVVDEAHVIAKKRGRNILDILKDLVKDVQKR